MNIIRKGLLTILYRWRGSKQLEYYNYLKKNQWNSLEKNIQIQKHLLYNNLKFSFNNIPYYKNLNINPDSFREDTIFEDIKSVPFLTKKELREEFDNLYIVDSKLKRIYANTSGGSTGEPTKFMQDNYYADWSAATKILFNEWAGRKIGDPLIKLWGSERDIFGQIESASHRLGNWVRNLKLLNSFRMTQEEMEKYVEEINLYKPKMILAYVQSIYELAKFAKENNIRVYSPLSIMTSAGVLYPEYRKLIEKVFNCPVFNRYGSREVGDMACDCNRHEGLHLNIFTHYIEIIDKKGKNCESGKMGEVVVTTLRNYTMPLIRFKIGDMAVLSNKQCSCGRGLPMIEKIVGRTNSMIRTNKGVFDSVAIETLLYFYKENIPFESFCKYQIIQNTKNNIELKVIVVNKQLWKKEKDKIRKKFKKVLGEDVSVLFKEVKNIEPSKSGKYMYVISEVEN